MADKNIPRPPFADDDGAAAPALAAALAAWSRDPAAEPELLRVLARSRLLVPVVAVLGEAEAVPGPPGTGGSRAGLRREKSSEMAVLTLTLPAGGSRPERRALPVFTSTEALSRWRPDARPVAVTAAQALSAAVQEGAATLLVDLAGPVTYPVAGAGLRALATGGAPAGTPAVAQALRARLAEEPDVCTAHLAPGGEGDGTLALTLAAGADTAPTVRRLAAALAADRVLRSHLVQGLRLAVLPPHTELSREPLYRRSPAGG